MQRNITWNVLVYSLTLATSPVPTVFPVRMAAAEEAPTEVTFRNRKMAEEMEWAAMAPEDICPKITVCSAVLQPHRKPVVTTGRLTRM